MTITINLSPLEAAYNRESWEYLLRESPLIADALAQVVKSGASPDAVRKFTMRHTGRAAIAARVEQAAAYLRQETA
jgi:hypothetical protein